jgi:NodT family efflux transporter outer membrane factor (OMF) lipoprotein
MTHIHKWRFASFATISAILLVTGCAVGPKFQKPAPPPPDAGYTATPLPPTTSGAKIAGGDAQSFVAGRDIPGEWWELFHSKPLNDLIERSLKANPNLKSAQAALQVAREDVLAQRGYYYPSASAAFAATRSKTSEALTPVPANNLFTFNLYTPQVSVAYVPDVFGLNRRTIESLRAQEQQARFALAAAHITLSSNVAAAAIQEASLRAQVDATRELISINTNMVRIVRNQYAKGYASQLDVAQQESQLAQVTATLPPLLKQLAQQRDLLAALSGGYPNQDLPEFEFSTIELPQDLPVSLPSQLVEQRPDVRQAEENLHSACAQIGVARANRFPSFPLTANIGSMALAFSSIFSPGTGFWDLGAAVAQPVFTGGTLKHHELAARAAYVQASEQYRSTVLTAFQNVADTLNALQQDADALKAAAAAKDAAERTLALATTQYQSGYTSYLTLLSAEQTYQQAVITLAQAQGNRYADTAALFQALGGGWWHRGDIPSN